MKATTLLRKDHETLRSLLDRLQHPAAGNSEAALFPELLKEVRTHLNLEEELLYPELENTASPAAMELVAKARRQHQEIESLLEKVGKARIRPGDDDQMAQLIQHLDAHLTFEESELFEEARQFFSEFRMEQLGLEMEDRLRVLGRPAA